MKKEYDKTEDWLKAIQSVGQMIGEILKEQKPGEKCNPIFCPSCPGFLHWKWPFGFFEESRNLILFEFLFTVGRHG